MQNLQNLKGKRVAARSRVATRKQPVGMLSHNSKNEFCQVL